MIASVQILSLVSLLATAPTVRSASLCVRTTPLPPGVTEVQGSLAESRAVFAGRVLRVTRPWPWEPDSLKAWRVLFQVDVSWKGDLTDTATVFSEYTSGVGPRYVAGYSYLVYAHATPHHKYPLATGTCSRSIPMSYAGPDLAELGLGTQTSWADWDAAINTPRRWAERLVLIAIGLILGVQARYKRGNSRSGPPNVA